MALVITTAVAVHVLCALGAAAIGNPKNVGVLCLLLGLMLGPLGLLASLFFDGGPRRARTFLGTDHQHAMKHTFTVLVSFTLFAASGWAADLTLWYRQPAGNRHIEELLPLGNGRMGCMLPGGVANERIQFNEQSLWSGDNNWDGGYDCGDHGFGAYRNFGELLIAWKGAEADPVIDSPSGHAQGDGNRIEQCVDGRADTKWCIADPGDQVVWRATLAAPKLVKS